MIVKSFDDFAFNKHGTAGRAAWCRECFKIYTQEYTERRKEEGVKRVVYEKECARCHMIKPRSAYGKKTRSTDGLNNYCKPCQKVKLEASRRKNLTR